ncbi:MAG: hypothetical protein HY785_15200 [Oscillatoriophycideae cyanobacterium NC_groundwater_1537_Pr4_S-0.65um_50_18]|nr:hypothetical protein [Oscillatoriophycideae cyanobacterium NC_groundwater_1537_Pr4_S-0.65um_50_18]
MQRDSSKKLFDFVLSAILGQPVVNGGTGAVIPFRRQKLESLALRLATLQTATMHSEWLDTPNTIGFMVWGTIPLWCE